MMINSGRTPLAEIKISCASVAGLELFRAAAGAVREATSRQN